MNFYMKRKEKIILTTIEILDELGFQGLSTKEICKRQGVSEGTLYKHFRSKDEVIIGVLEYYSKFDADIKETIEIKNLTAKEGITYIITCFAEYYESYPAMTAILNSHEVFRHEAGVAHKIIEIFESRTNYITNLIEKGIKSGEIKSDVDSDSLSDIILGSCTAITLKWRMRNCSFPLKEKILTAHDHIMKSC
jgi:AcrR family transcriptional regulator